MRTTAIGVGCVKTPTCNLSAEISSRFRQLENQKYLRPLLGEDDRENNSAHSWLVHVFTQPGREADIRQTPTLAKNRADSGNAQLARQDLLARSSLGARLDPLVAKAAEHPVVFVADRILAVEPLEAADRKMTVGRQRMPYFSEIYAHQGFAIT
jgi:hypothetical protein